MKKKVKLTAILLIAAVMLGIIAGCGKNNAGASAPTALSAMYSEDTELGEGEKTVAVSVETPEGTVKFTVHTDKDILGEALQDIGLIKGEAGEYGLYIKEVNGITADYDTNRSYWAFYINGEFAMSGVDTTEIDENAQYLLKYTKE